MEHSHDKNISYKEQRCDFQKLLIEKYRKTLLSIIVDYPGNNKNNNLTKNIISCIDAILNDMFKKNMFMKIFRISCEGPVITILLDIDSVKVKKICDQVEYQHILGGILNIEVYDENGKPVVSTYTKLAEKKCIICGEKASICKMKKNHNQWELVERIRNIYKEYTVSHHVKGY